MGEAKRKQMSKQAFLALPENGRCIYCGKKSETVDHFPPRVFFKDRKWPETYRFPACKACNSGKSQDELALAHMIKEQDLNSKEDRESKKIREGVRNNRPTIIDEVIQLTGNEAKQGRKDLFSEQFADKFPEDTHGIFRFGEEGQRLLRDFRIWLGQSLYFLHVKDLFLDDIFSTIFKPSDYGSLEFASLLGELNEKPKLFNGKDDLSSQFNYRYRKLGKNFFALIWFGFAQLRIFVLMGVDPDLKIRCEQMFDQGTRLKNLSSERRKQNG